MTYHDRPNAIPYLIAYIDLIIVIVATGVLYAACGVYAFFGPFMLGLLYVSRVYEIPNIFNARKNFYALTVALVMSAILSLFVSASPGLTLRVLFVGAVTAGIIIVSNVGLSRRLFDGVEQVWIELPADLDLLRTATREIEKKTLNKVSFRYASEPARVGRAVNPPKECCATVFRETSDGEEQVREERVSVSISGLFESILKRVPTELVAVYPELYDAALKRRRVYDLIKRGGDVVVSFVLLAVSLPLLLVVGVLILIEDGRPVIFAQERVGQGGKRFRIKKFRSLTSVSVDAADPNQTIESRKLKIGNLMRKTHIDEIVNLWCVLEGDMSIVGPRPEMPVYHELVSASIPGYQHRLFVKPGITGWAQINYRHTSSLEEYQHKTSLDLYYVKNRSFFLDMKILAKTAYILLTDHGSR